MDSRLDKYENNNLSMIILAGGKSSRMGTDKSDLIYREQTFLHIQIEKGRQLGITDILVSGYKGPDCGVPVVKDSFQKRGPLGGLEACLRRISHGRALVLGVDTPLVSVGELEGLIYQDKISDNPVTILRHGQRQEPLMGVYRAHLSDTMAEALEKGNGSVFAFLKKVGYGEYESHGEESQFQNINERADYQRLLGI